MKSWIAAVISEQVLAIDVEIQDRDVVALGQKLGHQPTAHIAGTAGD